MKILIVSDIHGNAEALKAVLKAEPDSDATIFLGDALLSGPQARQTAELLEDINPEISIMGNHDLELLDTSLFSALPVEWIALNNWIIESLDPHTFDSVSKYSQPGHFELGGMRFFSHHGDFAQHPKSRTPDSQDKDFEYFDTGNDCSMVLFGHSHVQFTREIGGKFFINPGSVGQPRCGKLQACYGVIEDGVYQARNVRYDPSPWLAALEEIEVLRAYPDLKEWMSTGLITGFGIGKKEPWTRFARQGYR